MKRRTKNRKERTREDFRRQARIHQALSNESRLLIVDRLEKGELSVGELVGHVNLDQSTVSKHLRVLYEAGIVDFRKEGSLSLYFLLTPCVLDMFSCTERVLSGREKSETCAAPIRTRKGGLP